MSCVRSYREGASRFVHRSEEVLRIWQRSAVGSGRLLSDGGWISMQEKKSTAVIDCRLALEGKLEQAVVNPNSKLLHYCSRDIELEDITKDTGTPWVWKRGAEKSKCFSTLMYPIMYNS